MLTRRDSWETYGSLRFFVVILNSVASREMRSVALQRILSWIIHAMQNHFMPRDCELNFSAIPRKYFVSGRNILYIVASVVCVIAKAGSWSLIANLKFKKTTLSLQRNMFPAVKHDHSYSLIMMSRVSAVLRSTLSSNMLVLHVAFTPHRISRILWINCKRKLATSPELSAYVIRCCVAIIHIKSVLWMCIHIAQL